MSPETKAWVKLLSLAIGTGTGICVASYSSGAKLWVAILCGLGAAATNVYHAIDDSPKQKTELQNPS